jgi:5-methylcytosine-specific restriction endonuclease McrA
MPIRPALRWYYPIDWPLLSRWVRFERAKGRCETCGRPHGQTVQCLRDGRWLDPINAHWRDGQGQNCQAPEQTEPLRTTRIVLAAAHLDHNPSNNRPANLRSLCQRCHMQHDRPHHLAQRWLTYRRRSAIGDLFLGRYP